MMCKRCCDADGVNFGRCDCPCHWDFKDQVQFLLNENTVAIDKKD